MKLLFVAYLEDDAVVRCVQKLQNQLYKQGVSSDLLTFRWDRKQLLAEKTSCGMRYRVDTWYRYAQLTRDTEGRISMPWYGYLRAASARCISMLFGGLAYQEQGFPFLAGVRLGKKLRQLCDQDHYDWVISVSYPFMIHRVVEHFHQPNVKWAMYALDPFYHNATYSSKREQKRLLLERKVSEHADCIFHVPEQREDYACKELEHIRAKYHALDYPNFEKPESVNLPSPLHTVTGGVNLVYLGTLYAEIRKPNTVLALFEQMHAIYPDLRLHLIGRVFGIGAGETIAAFKSRLGSALQTYQPMSETAARAALEAADILVSIGNTVQDQMPSKLWEYIATGKPILHVCCRVDCNTLPYLQKYPICWIYASDDAPNGADAAQAIAFVKDSVGKRLDWDTVQRIYCDYTVQNVTCTFLSWLQNVKEDAQ